MFITDDLRNRVAEHLRKMNQYALWLNGITKAEVLERQLSNAFAGGMGELSSLGLRFAVERALHMAIEYATDAANDIIDALVMREPGSYPDIIRVIAEEGVIPEAWMADFDRLLELRNRLVRTHKEITDTEIEQAATIATRLLTEYDKALRDYLR